MMTDNGNKILKNSDGEFKSIKLGSVFTEKQLADAIEQGTAANICEKVVRPNIEEINKKIGQQCDPMYISYMLEYALMSFKTNVLGA